MNQTDLQILVQLKDEASAAFKKVGENLSNTGTQISSKMSFLQRDVSGLSKTLLAGTLAAGGLAVAFGVESVKAFEDAQVAIAKVDSTLASMGESAIKNRGAILQAADAAIKLGFDDEDTALSITKFYQRTKDMTTAIELNKTAMDLARAKSIDLASATNLVNLALSGSGRALMQYGISIKDAATPLEALRQLQGQVTGQADAFSQTFKGQMEVLSVSFQNIKEQIGEVLVNALTPFIQQFTAWLMNPATKEQFKIWTEEFKSWADVGIPTLVDSLKIMFSWLQKIADVLINVGTGMNALINSFGQAKQKASGMGPILSTFAGIGGATQAFMSTMTGLQPFASGGIVTGPTPALVGESGPEAIIPLSQMGGMGGITVNLSGNFYGTDDSMAEKMGDSIAKIISQQLKLRSI